LSKTLLAARGNGNGVGHIGRDAGLPEIISAPPYHSSVGFQREAVRIAGSNPDGIG
jgi:hypothetical protein